MIKPRKPKVPTLKQIAARIQEHLTRIENDPKLNPRRPICMTHALWGARVWAAGPCLRIRYSLADLKPFAVLHKTEALQYLAYLDGGGTGTHLLGKAAEHGD